MSFPVPKFSVGDTVWVAQAYHTKKTIKCPTCLGTRLWKVVTPSGEELTIGCQDCKYGWEITGTKSEYSWEARPYMAVVSSVHVDYPADDDSYCEHPVHYFMAAPGGHSCTVIYETRVFADEVEALEASEVLAAAKRQKEQDNFARWREDKNHSFYVEAKRDRYIAELRACLQIVLDEELAKGKCQARIARIMRREVP